MAKQLYHAENLDFLQDPSENRLSKPRKAGLTMVMDKGMGIHAFTDLVQAAGKHIDYIKLGFGTAVLYPAHILQQKLSIAKQNDIQLFPGGTFFEVAYLKNQWP
jgi:phosphosulfolactate synthase